MVPIHEFANVVGQSFKISTNFTRKVKNYAAANGSKPPIRPQMFSANPMLKLLSLKWLIQTQIRKVLYIPVSH